MTTRDSIRAIIQAEVAQSNPIDDARRALELIVETHVRYAEIDGEPRITVVDDQGKPRSRIEDGQAVDLSIRDFVEELRAKRPTLFKPRASESPEPIAIGGVSPDNEPSGTVSEAATGPQEHRAAALGNAMRAGDPAPDCQDAARDWLEIGSEPLPQQARTGRRRRAAVMEPARRWVAAARQAIARVRAPLPRGYALRALGAAAVGSLLVLIGFLGFSLLSRPSNRPAVGRIAEASAPVAADAATTGAIPSEPEARQERAAGQEDAAALRSPAALRGIPEVLDTATLYLEGKILPLFGVEWARGGGNPDDLIQYLRGREVSCQPVTSSDTYRCEVGGQDLSRVVLFNGGGRATPEATPELKTAEQQARSARIGVWGR